MRTIQRCTVFVLFREIKLSVLYGIETAEELAHRQKKDMEEIGYMKWMSEGMDIKIQRVL